METSALREGEAGGGANPNPLPLTLLLPPGTGLVLAVGGADLAPDPAALVLFLYVFLLGVRFKI